MPQPHQKATDQELIDAYNKLHNTQAVASFLGLSSRRVQIRRREVESRYGIKLEADGMRTEAAKVLATLPTVDEQAQRHIRHLENEIAANKLRIKALHDELDYGFKLKQAITGVAEMERQPVEWMRETSSGVQQPTLPILMASDWHVGEVISDREMDGLNAFNQDIARVRINKLFERAIRISKKHMSEARYPGIVYARLGDMVSGEIHDELRETNDLHSIEAVRCIADVEAEGIERLVKAFGRVHVVTTPGNHGRTTKKPYAKRFANTNYDTLSAWLLEREFKNNPNVTFETTESGDVLLPIYGYNFLLTHGDRIGSRGGEGMVGPAATIARGVKKVRDYFNSCGVRVDWVLCGHFHVRLELEHSFTNGCLSGASEYSKSGRMEPSIPSQYLLFVHPERGVTARWPIYLEDDLRLHLK
jgi:hypothetical protein